MQRPSSTAFLLKWLLYLLCAPYNIRKNNTKNLLIVEILHDTYFFSKDKAKDPSPYLTKKEALFICTQRNLKVSFVPQVSGIICKYTLFHTLHLSS